jgi:shikimate kinase / 3-dehydroquinate synthase
MIYLTGFMGSGKTSVGEALSSQMKRPFIDLDRYITAKAGKSIPEIFACAGESSFRALENESLLEIAEGAWGTVISTGGGLPVKRMNRAVMKASGYVVYLKASFGTLITRIPTDPGRPLWNERASQLLEERKPAYEEADFIIDTEGLSVQEVARKIISQTRSMVNPLPVLVPSSPYPVYIGRGIFGNLGKYLGRYGKPEGFFVLVDENVDRYHKTSIKKAFRGLKHTAMIVPSGESSKSFPFLQQVLDRMFTAKMNRQWTCIAIGGGVTGDLAAFASSIFMRGIPVVQIPTTLLAQVDSSIGGKTGIDVSHGKNLVGTFHQPQFVLSDVDFLDTLDREQMDGAYAEVIKYGVIMDRELFEYLVKTKKPNLEQIVSKCSADKASIVTSDEREKGLRRILNFGHTLGHALEHASGYTLNHGMAVGAGMIFAAWLSSDMGLLQKKDLKRIHALVNRLVLKKNKPVFPRTRDIKDGIELDKKGTGTGIHFVLTQGIGDATVKKLSTSQILDAYERFVSTDEKSL